MESTRLVEAIERANDLAEYGLLRSIVEDNGSASAHLHKRAQDLANKLWPRTENPMNHVYDRSDIDRRVRANAPSQKSPG